MTNYEVHNCDAQKTRKVRPLFIDKYSNEASFCLASNFPNCCVLRSEKIGDDYEGDCFFAFTNAPALFDFLPELKNVVPHRKRKKLDFVTISDVAREIIKRQIDIKQTKNVEDNFLWRASNFMISACYALQNIAQSFDGYRFQNATSPFDDYDIKEFATAPCVVFNEGCRGVNFDDLINRICDSETSKLSTPKATQVSIKTFFDFLTCDRENQSINLDDLFNAFDEFACSAFRTFSDTTATTIISAGEDLQIVNILCAYYIASTLATFTAPKKSIFVANKHALFIRLASFVCMFQVEKDLIDKEEIVESKTDEYLPICYALQLATRFSPVANAQQSFAVALFNFVAINDFTKSEYLFKIERTPFER